MIRTKRFFFRTGFSALAALLALGLLDIAFAASSNIDPLNKWAWGSNIGWLNLNSTNGGATVCSDHLEGYAWAENIGWIKLGAGTGPYGNVSATNWGVNVNAAGRLFGCAWSETCGWIRFGASYAQVAITGEPGRFSGYAWSENLGWIRFADAGTFGLLTLVSAAPPCPGTVYRFR